MAGDSERDKLDEMAARIRQAELDAKLPESEKTVLPKNTFKASRAGFDFIATIGVCILLGLLGDRYFGTGPWITVGMIFMGFAVAMVGLWRTMDKTEKEEGGSK
jgi:F0F1-type ATP synthase assembly protein I